MLSLFTNLPRPIQALSVLGVTTGATSVGMAAVGPKEWRGFFLVIAIGILVVVVVIALYIFFLKMRDKAKSGPFASLIAKAGSGRGAVDPAQKARMDDMRKKFEEGVSTFKSAGKDLYSLPWYLLVGPSGSGKTEAMRHCNVGFPPGLQDCLQGTGGTMNMHWWFTNHAVVLDTAGRMFMEEGTDGQSTEWKEFMKLLKDTRANAPINGMLLVISAESLLKDSADKIEKTAGAIARQLDVVQRTLDVRFPVFVVVTKCDKIIGFREFFETLNDPALQHQMLGWSNPAPLDEVFRPDQVDQHLGTVRERLNKRRMGLLQNPVHTTDPNARRTDQVDEMFELPDNLVRIGPRLRRYLEMIFVAGEWSPKPLFLRGIYFTSSMREGQALDVSLAQALGIDVESIPGGKEWDKDKAYFLRDVFITKIFKERGLVTRAVNVSKALAKQRRLVFGLSAAAVILLTTVAVFGWFSFSKSLGPPSQFWSQVRNAYAGDEAGEHKPLDIAMVRSEGGKVWNYRGSEGWKKNDVLDNDRIATPADLVIESAAQTHRPIKPPLIAGPIVGFSSSWQDEQVGAHRAVVERAVVVPLIGAARSKLQTEQNWGPDAVAALAQLIRLETYALGSTPANVDSKSKAQAIDADVMFRYVLSDEDYRSAAFGSSRDKLVSAVNDAYPAGWETPSELLGGKDESSIRITDLAVDNMVKNLLALRASPGSKMRGLQDLLAGLTAFRDEELKLLSLSWFRGGPEGAAPLSKAEYNQFEAAFLGSAKRLAEARAEIDRAAKALGANMTDVPLLMSKASDELRAEVSSYFNQLRSELPAPPPEGLPFKGARELAELRSKLDDRNKSVEAAVQTQLAALALQVRDMAPMVTPGHADRDIRAYAARAEAYKLAAEEVVAAGAAPAGDAAPDRPAVDAMASLAGRIDNIDRSTTQLSSSIGALGAWVADSGQQPLLSTPRDAAVGAARKAVEFARSRRLYELAKQTIAGWPVDGVALSQHVSAVAAARIAETTFRKFTRPRVPLSDMVAGGEFKPEFHPQAAKEVLLDWAKVRELVDSSGSNRVVIGREELRAMPSYAVSAEATARYVDEYLRYWRTQALEASKPSQPTWAEFSQKLRFAGGRVEINTELQALADIVKTALAAVPPSPAWQAKVTREVTDTEAAFAGFSKAPYMEETASAYVNWSKLAELPAGRARDTLLDSLQSGKIKDEYLTAYRAEGAGLKYWNDLVINGLETLIKETQGQMEEARNGLVRDAKGVPLTFGPADLPDLRPDVVKAARGWAERLEGVSVSDKGVPGADTLAPELRALMLRLAGADIFRDPAARQWFTRIARVARIMGRERATGVFVGHATEAARPRRTGMGDDLRDLYRYAALRVGGRPRGPVFNLNLPIAEENQKELRVDLPLPANEETEIFLYKELPVGAAAERPDLKIPLPGRWSVMRPMLVDSGETRRAEKTDIWRVLITAPDPTRAGVSNYLWLTLRFEDDVPLQSDWPRADQWP